MRQLVTNDVFKMSRILGKMKLNFAEISIDDSDSSDQNFGVAVITKIAENLYLAQSEINEFLGSLCGMTGEEFGNLPITETLKYMSEFKNLDGISDFFKYAGRLTK